MPEGPEVETVRRTIEPLLLKQRVNKAWVRKIKLRNVLEPEEFQILEGKSIKGLNRHGKLLWLDFSGGVRAFVRLGMTGRLIFSGQEDVLEPHTHVRLALGDGSFELRYVDPRRFGEFSLSKDRSTVHLKNMGPDPTISWTQAEKAQISRKILGSSRSIKEILLDQKVLAGVGNIYASESLYAASISPLLAGNQLTPKQIEALLNAVFEVLHLAVKNCGTSFASYVDGRGNKGQNIHYLQVFMRQGHPCPKCKNTIKKICQAARSTYYCANCQHE